MPTDLPDAQTTKSAREATPRVPVVIDHEYFPHIMDAIIAAAPPKSLAMLAATNRAFRERLGFATHVEVIASVPKKGSLLFYFHVPGTHGRPIPHLPDAFQGMTLRGDRGPRDPKVDEAFKWFYFVDMTLRNEGNFDPDVSLPREIWPMYVRMPGLGATFNISGIANYTVLVGPPG